MLPLGRAFVNAQVTVDSSSTGAAAMAPRTGMLMHPGGDGRQRQQQPPQQVAHPGTATADPFVTLSDWKLQVSEEGGGGRPHPQTAFSLLHVPSQGRAVPLLACTYLIPSSRLTSNFLSGVRAEQQPEPH